MNYSLTSWPRLASSVAASTIRRSAPARLSLSVCCTACAVARVWQRPLVDQVIPPRPRSGWQKAIRIQRRSIMGWFCATFY